MNWKTRWRAAQARATVPLGLAILCQLVLCCVSLIYIARFKYEHGDYFDGTLFHIFYDPARLPIVILAIGAFAPVAVLFVLARFSFGYFVGFYLYAMIFSYLWLNCFSTLDYDHRLGGLSAAGSGIAFLLPALFIASPLRQCYVLSRRMLERLLILILLFAALTFVIAAGYNF